VETIKRQTRAACGCLAARSKSRVCVSAYRLQARCVCDAKRRCSYSLWRYISDGPLHFIFTTKNIGVTIPMDLG